MIKKNLILCATESGSFSKSSHVLVNQTVTVIVDALRVDSLSFK